MTAFNFKKVKHYKDVTFVRVMHNAQVPITLTLHNCKILVGRNKGPTWNAKMSGNERAPVRPPAPVTRTVGGDPAAAAETTSPALRGPLRAALRWNGALIGGPVNGEANRRDAAAVAMVLRRASSSRQLVWFTVSLSLSSRL